MRAQTSTDLSDHNPELNGDDVDMDRQMESGFKRTGSSFADTNPYAALADAEFDFEVFEPDTHGTNNGILLLPRTEVATVSANSGAKPAKKRAKPVSADEMEDLSLEEELLRAEQDTALRLIKTVSPKTWGILTR